MSCFRRVAKVLALALMLATGGAWADAYIYKGSSHEYNSGAAMPGDTVMTLNSSGFGGAEPFSAVLRQGSPDNRVAIILLHGRGEDYIDGHVVLPLRLALNDQGFTTLSIDIPATHPVPSANFAYANYQADAATGGANYVFPELYARIRAAETHLQSLGAKQAILIGFSLGSRFGSAYLRYGGAQALPIVGYVGIGMGSDAVVARLDAGTSMQGVSVPVLDLYGSADNPDVLSGVASRQNNYAGPNYTQLMQTGSGHQWVGYEAQLIEFAEPWVIANAHPNYSDSWWNSAESGWGLTITDHSTNMFVQWYTYDQTNHNQKYVIPGGSLSADRCTFSGTLQHVTGPSWTLASFDPALVVRTAAGSATIDFCPTGLAAGTIVFNYTADGVAGSKQLTRLRFGDDIPHQGGTTETGGVDYTDLWWNPNESGWGASITQHGNNVFARIYAYDTDNRPLLFVIPGVTFTSANAFNGTVQLTTGPWFGNSPFDPNQVFRTAGGTASFSFSDAANGVLSYTINGVTRTKAITRLAF